MPLTCFNNVLKLVSSVLAACYGWIVYGGVCRSQKCYSLRVYHDVGFCLMFLKACYLPSVFRLEVGYIPVDMINC